MWAALVATGLWGCAPMAARESPAPLAALGLPGVRTELLAAPKVEPIAVPVAAPIYACNEQLPQENLKRASYKFAPLATRADSERRKALHRAAIEYRTREYGHVDGFGDESWNALLPKHYARRGTFFGVGVTMNVRVLRALGCVEQAIKNECSDATYVPEVLDGLRERNTFHDSEVSNHLYGIAIDIDPNKNSCCGCVPPLSEWPRCKVEAASPFDRTDIPRCWVSVFERFGFHWLGHDELEDTMHFEFLGDPDRIERAD